MFLSKYGKLNLDRIMHVGEHFQTCGDYLNDIVRIRFTNPECGLEMRVIAVIQDVSEIRRILKHLKKIGRAPPGVDYTEISE